MRTASGYTISGFTTIEGSTRNFWLVNTDLNGNVVWSKTYGGNTYWMCYDAALTSDGGYALTGTANPAGSNQDLLLLKTDSAGNQQWNQTYGGNSTDTGYRVIQTPNGYALGGLTSSYGSFTSCWLILTDGHGQINYTLTTRTVGNGVVSTGNQTYISGSTVNLVANAADGWTFSGWSGDAQGTGSATVVMDANKTVTATFTENPPPTTTPTPSPAPTPSPTTANTNNPSTSTSPTQKPTSTPSSSAQPTPKPTSTPTAPEFSAIIIAPIALATIAAVMLKLKNIRK